MPALDLAWLRRRGKLAPGRSSSLSWSRGGYSTGSIKVQALPSGIRLTYAGRDGGEVSEHISFAETAACFGGKRTWFCCPSCGRPFRCRLCLGLKYGSQSEKPHDRGRRKSDRIRRRLGGSSSPEDPFPPKPRYMHWRTYRHLEELDEELRAASRHGAGDLGMTAFCEMFHSSALRQMPAFVVVRLPHHPREKIIQAFSTWLRSVTCTRH